MPNVVAYSQPDSQPNQNTGKVERIMPQNIDAEKAVLGAMLLSPDVVEEALMRLDVQDFYRPAHKKIFEAMEELFNKSVPIDQLSLADRLQARGDLYAIGGKPYIVELGNNSYALANWTSHADIIHREAMLRELIGASTRITALGYDAPDDLDEVVEQSEKLLLDVTNKQVETNFQQIGPLVSESFQEMQEISKSNNRYTGVRTGFLDLDELFGGLRGGDLIILAARPSIGKTALALNIATRAAYLGATVAYFSLEMPSSQLAQRIMCTEAHINLQTMRTGGLKEKDWMDLIKISNQLSKLNLYIDDTPSTSILEVRAKSRRQLRGVEPGKGLIIVDYLQLMQPQNQRTESRQVEIAEISRGLKILAKELDMPVLALSQLSRGVEARKGKRPMLSDLRESGAIEQDSDIVMFLDRSVNEREAEEEDRPPLGTADIIVAKHRNGPTDTIRLSFNGSCTRFDDYSPKQDY